MGNLLNGEWLRITEYTHLFNYHLITNGIPTSSTKIINKFMNQIEGKLSLSKSKESRDQ